MNCVIYGCGDRLKHTLNKLDVDYEHIEFADWDEKRLGKVFVAGKKILSLQNINNREFDFCMFGVENVDDKIRNVCESIGYIKSKIIPYTYLNSIWERWKKQEFHKEWKARIEDDNIQVISNWHVKKEDAECIIKIQNLSLYTISFGFCDFFSSKKEVQIWDLIDNRLIGIGKSDGKISWDERKEETIIKIVVKNSLDRIPWCSIEYSKTQEREQLEDKKNFRQLKSVYKGLTDFYYYDEDYLALKDLDAEGTILDLGANYGQSMYSFYQLTKSKIISVEAVPELYELLVNYVKIFDNQNRVKIINTGISDKKENLTWYELEGLVESGSFDKNFIESRKLNTKIHEKVLSCNSVDNIFNDLCDVWFVKIDIEGFEYQAIKGGMNLIQRNYPLILIEQNEHTKDIADFLQNSYELFYYDVSANLFKRERISRLNCWLIPKEEYRNDIVNRFIDGRMV